MRQKSILLIVAFLIISLFISACGKSGNEFIGSWQSKDSLVESIKIKANGDTFLCSITMNTFFGKKELEYPAVLKDGVLVINSGGNVITASHVKADDTLVMNGAKYTRQKQ